MVDSLDLGAVTSVKGFADTDGFENERIGLSMDDKFRLHADTVAAMEQELHILQTIWWKEIEEMLEAAKILGDLSNNTEYEFAVTEQNKCLERINNIKHILAHAVITDKRE